MKRLVRLSALAIGGSLLLSGTLRGSTAASDIPLAPPESVGFSASGLKAYEQALHALVDERRLAGVTTLVARHGKVVTFDAYGFKDVGAKTPMTRDTIFRIASMTKPIAGVAMMMLWEEGRHRDDPERRRQHPDGGDSAAAEPLPEDGIRGAGFARCLDNRHVRASPLEA